jgi:hypothetical protein
VFAMFEPRIIPTNEIKKIMATILMMFVYLA